MGEKNFLTSSHWILRVYNTAHFQSTKLGQLFLIAVQSIDTHSLSNVWNILSFQIPDNVCYQVFTFSYQVDIKWYLIAILISISQIISKIGCLFTYLNGCPNLLFYSFICLLSYWVIVTSYWVVEINCIFYTKNFVSYNLCFIFLFVASCTKV